MPTLPRMVWVFRLKGRRTAHLADSDEWGQPISVSLCGNAYDPADRTGARKTTKIAQPVCHACLANTGYVDPHKKWLKAIPKIAEQASAAGFPPKATLALIEEVHKRLELSN